MSANLKVAVVGTGGWGEQHARIFWTRRDTDLVAIVGRTPEKTGARAEKYETRPYTDIDKMLDAEQPDLVTVVLPNEGHFEPTLHLIERGVPLLVEKPLVFNLAEADLLLDEAAKRNLFFAINLNHRYAEPVKKAKAAIQAGELGDIVFAIWRFGGEPPTRRWLSLWSSRTGRWGALWAPTTRPTPTPARRSWRSTAPPAGS